MFCSLLLSKICFTVCFALSTFLRSTFIGFILSPVIEVLIGYRFPKLQSHLLFFFHCSFSHLRFLILCCYHPSSTLETVGLMFPTPNLPLLYFSGSSLYNLCWCYSFYPGKYFFHWWQQLEVLFQLSFSGIIIIKSSSPIQHLHFCCHYSLCSICPSILYHYALHQFSHQSFVGCCYFKL